MNRRRFLGLAAGAGAAAIGLPGCGGEATTPPGDAVPPDTPRSPATPIVPTAVAADRLLVMIELTGGNDGLDTLVPFGDPRYRDLRPTIGLDLSTVLALDDEVAVPASLANLHRRGVAWVQGVGTPEPDLGHGESLRRWWEGDVTGQTPQATGFLGRLADQLGADAPVAGVSIASGPAPGLRSAAAATMALAEPGSGAWLLSEDPWLVSFRQGLDGMARGQDDSPLLGAARGNLTRAMDFLATVAELPEGTMEYPGTDLANRLALTARLLGRQTGVRIVHVPFGDFDTHAGHRGRHDELLTQLDVAVDTFLADLDERGLADQVLVATSSEFGRRPQENADGTDHGTASVALLAGPVHPGRHGEYPSLTRLDDTDNLVATVGLDTYYATIAEAWFGVPAADVLPGRPRPIPGIIA